ncbi:MAG TPA: thiolase family protein, partial [Acidimicrobiia bacterium]|nr:thiolase family protein [Acidimicrobiia bacterium]
MTTPVEVAGIGIHPFGRFEDRTVTELGVTAVREALHEAGDPRLQAAFCGTAYAGVAAGHKVLGAIGRTGIPIVDVEAGCASGGAALMLAAGAIRAGQYDSVLVFGIEKMPRGIIRSSFFEPWREEAGLAATPAYFALRAQRLMRESGVTKNDLADVVVKNRAQGVDNPDAMFRAEVTAEQVLASRVVCEPLHLWMLCSPNEGAAAVVLRAAASSVGGGVTLEAAALRSHLPGSVLSEATPLSGFADDTVDPPTTLAARAAYEESGLGPADLDVVECQDTDAARELLSYEELGLCPKGDAGKWLSDGVTRLG